MTEEQLEKAKDLNKLIYDLNYRLKAFESNKRSIDFNGFMLGPEYSYGISNSLFDTIAILIKSEMETRIKDLQQQFKQL